MSTSQDSVQLDQRFDILSSCPLVVSDDSSSSFPQQDPTEQQCPAHTSFSPTRSTEKSCDQEVREPLKEVTKGKKGNQETAEQEQQDADEKEESSSGDNGDKLNDYVAKVLDKLTKQRNKLAKLNSSLEKRGSASKRRAVQEADEVHSEDSDSGEEDHSNDAEDNDNSKENLSPIKAKHSAPQETRQVLSTISQKPAAAPSHKIEDVLQISKSTIHYGSRFPGQVAEEHFEIVNKSGHDFVVQIIVSCLNEELKDTDEYVYSVRRSHLYDYNDKHYLIMAPYSCAAFKFALKVPNMKLSGTIMGQVEVSIQGGQGSYTLDLSADVSVPKVFCPKELRCNGLDYKVIKLAIKEGKKQDIKIPIKNSGDVPVTLDFEFFEPKDGSQDGSMVDCVVHPNSVTIPANGLALTSILVKPVKSMGKTKLEKGKPVRKIMVGRVRDSALVYSFVFWIELY